MLDPDRRHLIAYLAAAAVLVVIAARLVSQSQAQAPPPTVSMAAPAAHAPQATSDGERPRAEAKPIWVDVAGAVQRPGLYSLPAGARIAAAIERAGGVRAHADTVAVNLAAKLADGQQIVVPLRGHGGSAGSEAAGASGSAASAGAASGGGALASGAKISLSNASQEQLETLDGVGPALAARIIAYRQAHGGFRSVDQLQEVSGFGPKRLQALRGGVTP